MQTSNLHYAKTHLSRLVDAALTGEEVIIARAGTPLVRLVPITSPRQPRQLGLDAGKIVIHDDFEDPMPELEDLFYGEARGETQERERSGQAVTGLREEAPVDLQA